MSSKKISGFYPNKPIYKCTHCQYEIKNSRRAIDLHLKISHGIDRKSQITHNLEFCEKEDNEKFVCGVCRKYFPSKKSLEYHNVVYKHFP